jgi:hypothetical protein
MSNIFAGKKTAKDDGIESDFLGGGGVLDTDIYLAKIKAAYIGKAANSDAKNVTLLLDVNGREVRSQIWVSNRNGDVTYKDKTTKEDKNLPGFNQINSLCLLVTGKPLGEMDVEELTVKVYDYDAKKELPVAVDCFKELHGEKINIALQRQTVDKTAKNDATGEYDPTGETRDQNEIVKFFAAEKLVTISEVEEFIKSLGENFNDVVDNGHLLKAMNKMGDEAGNYADKWLDRNKGQIYDKSSGKKAEGKAFVGANKAANDAGAKKKTSLFDD